jgi:pyruvate dehydrogenase E2 component (dihydrolipoamide acetyltransferase)
MAIPITIPRLGWNMDEGVFVGWLKNDGDLIQPGDNLFSLESDKAAVEIESLDGGVLHIPADGPKPGQTLAVGAVIGYLIRPGEAITQAPLPARETQASAALAQASPAEALPPPVATDLPSILSPPPRRKPAISPRARRAARELHLDWTTLSGSGKEGRIRERDVRAAAAANPLLPAGVVVPLSPMRRAIAERMTASSQATAAVTLTTTADASNLVNLRNQFKALAQPAGEAVPTCSDFLVKLTAIALQSHPHLNACWLDDHIVTFSGIHIGIAVDTEAGLLVPVVRDVPALSVKQLSARTRDLIERARRRQLTPAEMQGGTFTLTNLGALGIDAFSPIIHGLQCAILGLGRIQSRPVVRDDQIVIREEMTVNLTFDHRVVDGAPAARFLQTLTALIENPGPRLIT